ncbi:hypothetical protein [Streptomyces sp. NPDC047014]|uniref:hypothetical protein n=1 Tax=Streptomyces sp. NPDC047014 TaxID=3155736 RepID=UPI0033C41F20
MPSRSAVQTLDDGTVHRTGIWIGNQKQRRDRLSSGQLAALAALGVDWAATDQPGEEQNRDR